MNKTPDLIDYFVHPTAVIDSPCNVGSDTRVWHFCHLSAGCTIGRRCSIGQNVFVAGSVTVGDGVKIQNNVSLYDGVTLQSDVFVGPSAVFTNVVNPRAAISRKDQYRPTLVKQGATIGANATIVCGATLGRYSFIAAGAVVAAQEVADFALMAGVPARQKGWVSRAGEPLTFDSAGVAVCRYTGEHYQLIGDSVVCLAETTEL